MLHQAESLDVLGEDVAPIASLGRGLDIWLDTNLLSDNGLEQGESVIAWITHRERTKHTRIPSAPIIKSAWTDFPFKKVIVLVSRSTVSQLLKR